MRGGIWRTPPRPYEYRVSLRDGRLAVAEAGVELIFNSYERSAGRSGDDEGQHGIDQRSAYFDLDELHYPLTVRNRRPGDRIQLWNTQGSKKLKDLFIDLKIPPSKRDAIPLIVDAEDRVLWVCGIRRSRHAPVQPGTRNILQIKLVQNERNHRDID
ncbi:tRNA lysidine(34) synthetase TilS [Insulibacter thermoxylanivorax]|uniref:tRNA lysidine(34) synthetase TilS n=1 Tax=Insulibacter thermoxylanivorax TaxID=2749268 RepID=UPI001F5BB57A|nr:tRNA lysidine(34) synthetase TilS [Insulibacter thermoxylanivorax]